MESSVGFERLTTAIDVLHGTCDTYAIFLARDGEFVSLYYGALNELDSLMSCAASNEDTVAMILIMGESGGVLYCLLVAPTNNYENGSHARQRIYDAHGHVFTVVE